MDKQNKLGEHMHPSTYHKHLLPIYSSSTKPGLGQGLRELSMPAVANQPTHELLSTVTEPQASEGEGKET
jgi:hypothetical protein